MPKLVMIDYITEEIGKLNPDKSEKHMIRHNNYSLNRLIATKMLEKQKNKSRNSHNKDYNFMLESRKRIATECIEDVDK